MTLPNLVTEKAKTQGFILLPARRGARATAAGRVHLAQRANLVPHHGDPRSGGELRGLGELPVDDVLPHGLDEHGVVVAGTVEDGELALPQLVGLGKVLVELRDVQKVRVQAGQGVGHIRVSQT